jgi:peptidoglycan/LPS O-acetylase OafA/YrhL
VSVNNRRGAILPGIILIALGLWFLADALGLPLPGLGDLWPIFPLGFGLAMLAQYFIEGRRSEGLVFTGVSGTLIGAFFFTITLGPLSWGDLGIYWPVFPLIGGLAFLAQWLARPSERGLLVPALLGLGVGGLALLFTLNLLGSAADQIVANLWPAALILLGLGLLANYALSGRKKQG